MNDIDNVLRSTINDLAGEVRMRPDLASTAMASGRRRLRRRRAGTVLAAALAAASVAVSTPYALDRNGGGDPPPASVAAEPATLPLATGVPGAAQRPDLIGSDPRVLHFDVDLAAVPGLTGTWWSTNSWDETLNISLGEPTREAATFVTMFLTRPGRPTPTGEQGPPAETTQVTVAGRPATLARYETAQGGNGLPARHHWRLSWEPVAGLPVVVRGGPDGQTLQTVAAAIRFDRARRCVVPMRVTGLPAPAKVSRCDVGLDATGALVSASVFADFPAPIGGKDVSCGTSVREGLVPNRTVDGAPAIWTADERSLFVPGAEGRPSLRVSAAEAEPDVEARVTALLRKVEFAGDPRDPATWPRHLTD